MNDWLEEHLDWRPLRPEDLQQVDELRLQIEELDDSMLRAMERENELPPDHQLENNAIGGWDNYGNLLAYGINVAGAVDDRPRVLLVGGVHPTHRYLKIGRALLAWQEAQAKAWRDLRFPGEELWLGCYAERNQPSLRRMLERNSYRPERLFHDMYRDLSRLPEPTQVDGVEFTQWDESCVEETRALHNRCFKDFRLRGIDETGWRQSVTHDAFRSQWSWVARKNGAIVGYALAHVDLPSGTEELHSWTDRLGVDPAYRGQGISTALLTRGLHAMAADGCLSAGIGVDTVNENFLEHLEHHLGYATRDAITLMSKRVGPVR